MPYLTEADIDSIFSHHAPTSPEQVAEHEQVRAEVRALAHRWNTDLPGSPEATLAIRALQKAMMFANSAIAQHSGK